jgi:beta-N-acetylhexosaminidase
MRTRTCTLSLTLVSLLALACGSVYVQRRISASELLSNHGVNYDDIPLSTRTYVRLPFHAMDRALTDLCIQATDAEKTPSIVFAVGDDQGLILRRAFGFGRLEPGRAQPATLDTIYDLASLTKVIATTTAVMQLWERGQIDLDDPVVKYLPEYDNHGKGVITIRQCLTHTAGFKPFYRLWVECQTPEEARHFIENCELDHTPGTRYIYSDVGFITLGWLVERVSGQPLDQYCAENVFRPLGMTHTLFNPPEGMRPLCAATEFDRALRHKMIQGEVHDENSAFLGGVAGHAGLFSTVSDLSRFCLMLLRGGEFGSARILRPETIAEMTRQQIELPDGDGTMWRRGLGWWLNSPGAVESAGGAAFSDAMFGHTGFTGPAIEIDPQRRVFAVFLSNRVHARASQWDNPEFRAQSYARFRPVRVAFFNAVEEGLQ